MLQDKAHSSLPIKFAFLHLMLILSSASCSSHISLHTEALSARLQEVVEKSLKRAKIQEYLDSLNYNVKSIEEETINTIFLLMKNNFKDLVDIIRNLQAAVLKNYIASSEQQSQSVLQCCAVNKAQFSKLFNLSVDFTQVCAREVRYFRPTYFSVNSFDEACLENLKRIPWLKWQYFKGENGRTLLFPATPSGHCLDSDINFRSWYVQSIAPKPKHVVVVIDKSGSMDTLFQNVPRMIFAKKAAKAVISTLCAHDMSETSLIKTLKFSVLAFSTTVESIKTSGNDDSCFSTNLAQANPHNKGIFFEFIDKIQTGGGTRYTRAISKAFELLRTAYTKTSEMAIDRVILFMSDGEPEDSKTNILTKLSSETQLTNNETVIFTYGIGDKDFTVLKDIAKFNPEITKRSQFFRVSLPTDLEYEMTTYFKYLSFNISSTVEPYWTAPYLDMLGLGHVITINLPVVLKNKTIGVVGADLTLRDIMSPSANFRKNVFAYSFVISGSGLLMNHPLYVYDNHRENSFIYATAFEQDDKFLPIFKSMKRGMNGYQTFMATRNHLSRRYSSEKELNISTLSKYIWRKIPYTNFSICFVLPLNYTHLYISLMDSLPVGSFLYHRFDLLPPKAVCAHVKSIAALNQSSIVFPPRAFNSQYYLASSEFSREDLKAMANYLEGTGPNALQLKDYVKEEVLVTQRAETYWTLHKEVNEVKEHVLWRFIGTDHGIFRIFPGTHLPTYFDPVTRPWYIQAASNPDKYVITVPYLSSGVPVITLSRALFKRLQDSNNYMETFGVTGVDLSLQYFHDILYDLYDDQTAISTYLIDANGEVILCNTYTKKTNNEPSFISHFHILKAEPAIARVLLHEGWLRKTNCSNINDGFLQRQYEFSPPSNSSELTKSFKVLNGSCYEFFVSTVPKTNVFLLIRNNTVTECKLPRKSCSCASQFSSEFQSCTRTWSLENTCECPCLERNVYLDSCQNKYNMSNSYVPPPCFVTIEFSFDDVEESKLSTLPQCYEIFLHKEETTDSLTSALIAVGVVIFLLGTCLSTAIIYGKKKTAVKREKAIRSVKKNYIREIAKAILAEDPPVVKVSPSITSPSRRTSNISPPSDIIQTQRPAFEPYDSTDVIATFLHVSFYRSESWSSSSKYEAGNEDSDVSNEMVNHFSPETKKYLSEIDATFSGKLTHDSPMYGRNNIKRYSADNNNFRTTEKLLPSIERSYSDCTPLSASSRSSSDVSNEVSKEVMNYFT